MKFAIIFALVFGVAYGANSMCWTVDQIATAVIKEADVNGDGILEYGELTDELLNNWSLSNDSCLSFHDFMTNWIAKFHDHHDTAHQFFNRLDLDKDHKLCLMDVAVQIVTYDTNPTNGQIEPAEFNTFMHAVHPDSHQNGGHGHGC